MPTIALRTALPPDAPTLRYWDTLPHVMGSDPQDATDSWDWDVELNRQLPWRQQLLAEADGRPVGMLQIIDPMLEDTHYWGNIGPGFRAIDIWIGPADCLGKGYGTQMMRQALALCFQVPDVHTVLIDPLVSNTDAIRFYERLGFEAVEERWFGHDLCRVYQFTRQHWASLHRS